ncbi:MAG: acetyltransferase [Candidatus Gastranaerophilales bacterium]|nr:acetyltransferase [Candidatus Gastranaerophilales bacterium]
MKKLIIYGALVPDTVKLIDTINDSSPTWELIGYIDDNKERHCKTFMDYPILGGTEIIPELIKDNDIYFFATYYGKLSGFKNRVNILESYGCKFANLIHPSINIKYVKIGKGCFLAEGCNLGANIEIGNYVNARIRAVICHNTTIEDFSFIGPNSTVGSGVVLKEGCFIGTGATILRTKTLGKASTIGAGAMVVKNVPDGITVVGVPAKKIRKSLFKRAIHWIKRQYTFLFSKNLKEITFKLSQKTQLK